MPQTLKIGRHPGVYEFRRKLQRKFYICAMIKRRALVYARMGVIS